MMKIKPVTNFKRKDFSLKGLLSPTADPAVTKANALHQLISRFNVFPERAKPLLGLVPR